MLNQNILPQDSENSDQHQGHDVIYPSDFDDEDSEADSLKGPSTSTPLGKRFAIFTCLFVATGAANVFVSKTTYQLFPSHMTDWLPYCLMLSQFLSGIPILCIANKQNFKHLNRHYLWRFVIISIFDLFVHSGKYIALLYLPAAIVLIPSTLMEILFLFLIRVWRGRKITVYNWIGIIMVLLGVFIVSLNEIFGGGGDSTTNGMNTSSIIGFIIMCSVGIVGAIRGTIEEILLKSENNISVSFDPQFMLGMESLITSILTIIFGIILILCNFCNATFDKIIPTLKKYLIDNNNNNNTDLIIVLCLFLIVVFLENIFKLFVTQLSSAMTRRLFQTVEESLAWVMSLVLYYSVSKGTKLGESWSSGITGSILRLIGFVLVYIGIVIFVKKASSISGDMDGDNDENGRKIRRKQKIWDSSVNASKSSPNRSGNRNGYDARQKVGRTNSRGRSERRGLDGFPIKNYTDYNSRSIGNEYGTATETIDTYDYDI